MSVHRLRAGKLPACRYKANEIRRSEPGKDKMLPSAVDTLVTRGVFSRRLRSKTGSPQGQMHPCWISRTERMAHYLKAT
jgi:hypothetical protein